MSTLAETTASNLTSIILEKDEEKRHRMCAQHIFNFLKRHKARAVAEAFNSAWSGKMGHERLQRIKCKLEKDPTLGNAWE